MRSSLFHLAQSFCTRKRPAEPSIVQLKKAAELLSNRYGNALPLFSLCRIDAYPI